MLNSVKSWASKRCLCRAGDAQLAEPLQQPVLQPSACKIGDFFWKSQLNSSWQGRERSAPHPAASNAFPQEGWLLWGNLATVLHWLPTHPNSAFALPAASSPGTIKQLWWAPASVPSLEHMGGSYNYSALQDVTPSFITCCLFPACSQTSLSSLPPTLPKVTHTPQPFTTFFSIPDFIPHNPAYGNTSKETFPHHTVLLSQPHLHIAHSFPAITCMRQRKTGTRGAGGQGHWQMRNGKSSSCGSSVSTKLQPELT